MAKQIVSFADKQAARRAETEARGSNFETIVREARKGALNFTRNQDDQADAQTKSLFKLYGSAQAVGAGEVLQIESRDMSLNELPGYVALVRECKTPLNKMRVTADFGGALVFAVPANSSNPDIAEIYDLMFDEVAIAFSAVAAIRTNRNLTLVPGQYLRNGQPQLIAAPCFDDDGNRLGRLGDRVRGVATVASVSAPGTSMRALLGRMGASAPASSASLEEVANSASPGF